MRPVLALTTLIVLVAGCAGDPVDDTPTDPDPDTQPVVDDFGLPPPEPVEQVAPVSFAGNIGTAAYGCEYEATSGCYGEELDDDDSQIFFELPGATWTGADITLTWDAPSPATETLTIGIMRMGDNSTAPELVEGTSPLTLQVSDLDLLLDAENLIHIFVYNSGGFVSHPPGYVYASTAQEFTIEGSLTLLVPQDGA